MMGGMADDGGLTTDLAIPPIPGVKRTRSLLLLCWQALLPARDAAQEKAAMMMTVVSYAHDASCY